MKTFLHKAVAFGLALSMVTTTTFATTLGSWTWQSSVELGDTVELSQGQFYGSSRYQTESVVEFSSADGLIPMVVYGNTLYGRSDMDYMTAYVESQGYTPVAAINGSFFDLTTGIPYGAVVTDGVVRVSGSSSAVGFFADGSTIIGNPDIALEITMPDGTKTTGNYNREMTTASGIAVFSRDYDYTTKDYQESYNVVLSVGDGQLTLGESIQMEVIDIQPDTTNCAIPEGAVVMAMDNSTQFTHTFENVLKTLEIGDTVTIGTTVASGWEDVQYVCGGDDMLVTNGKAATSFTLDSAEKITGRTAIGIKADGTTVLYTVDGLQTGYSSGISLADLATRMVELGCVTALNLDGGGSTTVGGRFLGYGDLETLNSPSDGKQRECANFIFLVRETTTAKSAEKLHLYPYDSILLTGASQEFLVKATDSNDMVATVPSGLEYSTSAGSVDENGIFTAGEVEGTVTVTAQSGSVSGSTMVKIIETPSSMAVKNEATNSVITTLALQGGITADLTATALYYGANVVTQDVSFGWIADEAIGTIDENGLFTAANVSGTVTGTITVTAGELSQTVAVTVSPQTSMGSVVATFESAILTSGEGITASLNESRSYVRYGNGSGKLVYNLNSGKDYVTSELGVSIPSGDTEIGLWVYGDNSNNSLSAYFIVDGVSTSKWLTQLNFSGWKLVTATMPAGSTVLESLKIVSYEEATADSGTIYIDQISTSNLPITDQEGPEINMDLGEMEVTMTIRDDGSGLYSTGFWVDGIQTTYNGIWTFPNDGIAHQLRLEACDNLGNLAVSTLEIPGDTENIFVDVTSHWAKGYVNYAYNQGYLKGSENSDGDLEFRPDSPMTRQEFAVALTGFLGVDTTEYSTVELPFADVSNVSSWALDSVKAAYSLGLITGAQEGNLLYGNPTATITRQEAMAILARTLEKGYEMDDLSGFSDGSTVASWAKDDIAIMVSMGVISGTSDGKLEPSSTVTRGQVAKMLKMLY